jgi:hypothetical protein
MVWVSHLEELSKMIGRLHRLALEVTLSGSDVFFIEVISRLVIFTLIAASSNGDPLGRRFGPLLLPLALLFAPLPAAIGSDLWLLTGTAFPSP